MQTLPIPCCGTEKVQRGYGLPANTLGVQKSRLPLWPRSVEIGQGPQPVGGVYAAYDFELMSGLLPHVPRRRDASPVLSRPCTRAAGAGVGRQFMTGLPRYYPL